MQSVVGIFRSRPEAERAIQNLRRAGIPADRINLLSPGSTESEIHSKIPTADTEQPGMGKAIGGVVGAVAGGTAGMGLAEAAASFLVPGLGPITAVGLAAAALFGAGGAVGGAAAGGALESRMSHGLPKDELYVYEHALHTGHAVVFAFAKDSAETDAARRALEQAGAQSLDEARESWWVGIREVEKEHFASRGEPFPSEAEYRRGFEAAQHPDWRDREFSEEPAEDLKARYGRLWENEAFRRGYERGKAHARNRFSKARQPARTA